MSEQTRLVGYQSGRLKVDSMHSRRNGRTFWLCVCECGGTKVLRTNRITGKRPTRSCGCLQREVVSRSRRTHGLSRTYYYRLRSQIIQRCTNPNHPAYSDYGGRGITICPRWISSIEAFMTDIGERPSDEHTIDRIDNNGNYEPGNVRWATKIEQARNRRSNRFITANGETLTLAEWIERSGLAATTIERRLKRGWDPARAVLSPSSKS